MAAVSPEMQRRISDKLTGIEQKEGVRILFAVESGSRAWGFHSPDSDYDVRFVYTRPLEWHFRLGKTRDVIEYPIDDELDISGWELRKALTLALGSNAVVAEWLQSPITYKEDESARTKLLSFVGKALIRKSTTWHYLSLVHRQASRLAAPDGGIRIKRYFYVLRPILALRWMRLHAEAMPPMDMARLREGCNLSVPVANALDQLTALKMRANERSEGHTRSPLLELLISEEIAAAKAWLENAEERRDPTLWQEADVLHQELSLQRAFSTG